MLIIDLRGLPGAVHRAAGGRVEVALDGPLALEFLQNSWPEPGPEGGSTLAWVSFAGAGGVGLGCASAVPAATTSTSSARLERCGGE
jgi:hypothetical protein